MASQKSRIFILVGGLVLFAGAVTAAVVFRGQIGTFVQRGIPSSAPPVQPVEEADSFEQLRTAIAELEKIDSTENRLKHARTANKITHEQALVYELQSFLDPQKVPIEYQGTKKPDYIALGILDIGQDVLEEALAALEQKKFSATQEAQVAELFSGKRKTGAAGAQIESPNYLVHYNVGKESLATKVSAQLEASRAQMSNEFLFATPRGDGDCPDKGPDARTDVYIENIDDREAGEFRSCWKRLGGYKGGSIYIDETLSDDLGAHVAKHEFVHSVQFEYPKVAFAKERWYIEATAEFFATRMLSPEVRLDGSTPDAAPYYKRNQMTHQYSLSNPLNAFEDIFENPPDEGFAAVQYSREVFFIYLSEVLGKTQTSDTIRSFYGTDGTIDDLKTVLTASHGPAAFQDALTYYSHFNGIPGYQLDGYRDGQYYSQQAVNALLPAQLMTDFASSGAVKQLASYRVRVPKEYLALGEAKGATKVDVTMKSATPAADFSFFVVYQAARVDGNKKSRDLRVILPLVDNQKSSLNFVPGNTSYKLTSMDLVGVAKTTTVGNYNYQYLVEFPGCKPNQNLKGGDPETCGPGEGTPPPGYLPPYQDAACDNVGICTWRHGPANPHHYCSVEEDQDNHFTPGGSFEQCNNPFPQGGYPYYDAFNDSGIPGSGTDVCGLPASVAVEPEALTDPKCFTLEVSADSTVQTPPPNQHLTPLEAPYKVLYNDLSVYKEGATPGSTGESYITAMPHNENPALPATYYIRVKVPANMQLRPGTGQTTIDVEGEAWAQKTLLYYDTSTPQQYVQFLFEPVP